MKKNIFRVVSVLLALGWMLVIFGFSAQSGEESGGMSGLISQPIADMIAVIRGVESDETLFLEVDIVVRKIAHFCEYAVLGGLLLLALYRFGVQAFWIPWGIGVLYAILDEWHQSFMPGRVCAAKDVLIDACGLLCGVLLTNWLMKVWREKHVQHQ